MRILINSELRGLFHNEKLRRTVMECIETGGPPHWSLSHGCLSIYMLIQAIQSYRQNFSNNRTIIVALSRPSFIDLANDVMQLRHSAAETGPQLLQGSIVLNQLSPTRIFVTAQENVPADRGFIFGVLGDAFSLNKVEIQPAPGLILEYEADHADVDFQVDALVRLADISNCS